MLKRVLLVAALVLVSGAASAAQMPEHTISLRSLALRTQNELQYVEDQISAYKAAQKFRLIRKAANDPIVDDDGVTISDWIYDDNDTSSDCDCMRVQSGGVFTVSGSTVTVTLPTQSATSFQTFANSPIVYVTTSGRHNAEGAAQAFQRKVTITNAPTNLGGLNLNGTFVTGALEHNRFYINVGTNASSSAGPSGTGDMQWKHNLSTGDKVIHYVTSQTVGGLNMDDAIYTITVDDETRYHFTHGSSGSTVSTPTGTTVIVKPEWSNELKLRFVCAAAHLAYDDPIVNPGQQGVAHLHQFFGNDATNFASTYASLRRTGHGSCEGGDLNKTGYWQPAMMNFTTRKAIKPIYWVIYYVPGSRKALYTDGLSGTPGLTSPECVSQGGSGNAQDGTPIACPMQPLHYMERGLKMIWGFRPTANKFPDTYCDQGNGCAVNTDEGRNFDWSCYAADGTLNDGAKSNFEDLVGCASPGLLEVRMGTPGCWDGRHDTDGTDTDGGITVNNHYTHIAVGHNDGNGNSICPATHPKQIPSLTVLSFWGYTSWTTVQSQWALSSDRFNAATYKRGKSYHTDWFGAWKTAIQDQWSQHIMGMKPTINSFPYIYNSTSGASPLYRLAGGPYVTTTNNGGLGNCSSAGGSSLGFTSFCSMKSGDLGNGHVVDISFRASEEVDIPSPMRVHLRRRKVEEKANPFFGGGRLIRTDLLAQDSRVQVKKSFPDHNATIMGFYEPEVEFEFSEPVHDVAIHVRDGAGREVSFGKAEMLDSDSAVQKIRSPVPPAPFQGGDYVMEWRACSNVTDKCFSGTRHFHMMNH